MLLPVIRSFDLNIVAVKECAEMNDVIPWRIKTEGFRSEASQPSLHPPFLFI